MREACNSGSHQASGKSFLFSKPFSFSFAIVCRFRLFPFNPQGSRQYRFRSNTLASQEGTWDFPTVHAGPSWSRSPSYADLCPRTRPVMIYYHSPIWSISVSFCDHWSLLWLVTTCPFLPYSRFDGDYLHCTISIFSLLWRLPSFSHWSIPASLTAIVIARIGHSPPSRPNPQLSVKVQLLRVRWSSMH